MAFIVLEILEITSIHLLFFRHHVKWPPHHDIFIFTSLLNLLIFLHHVDHAKWSPKHVISIFTSLLNLLNLLCMSKHIPTMTFQSSHRFSICGISTTMPNHSPNMSSQFSHYFSICVARFSFRFSLRWEAFTASTHLPSNVPSEQPTSRTGRLGKLSEDLRENHGNMYHLLLL